MKRKELIVASALTFAILVLASLVPKVTSHVAYAQAKGQSSPATTGVTMSISPSISTARQGDKITMNVTSTVDKLYGKDISVWYFVPVQCQVINASYSTSGVISNPNLYWWSGPYVFYYYPTTSGGFSFNAQIDSTVGPVTVTITCILLFSSGPATIYLGPADLHIDYYDGVRFWSEDYKSNMVGPILVESNAELTLRYLFYGVLAFGSLLLAAIAITAVVLTRRIRGLEAKITKPPPEKPLVELIYCPRCGAKLMPETIYCHKCGQRLR